jgi:hypothetical protein
MSGDACLNFMAAFPTAAGRFDLLPDPHGASRFNSSVAPRHDPVVSLELAQPRNVTISLKHGAGGPAPATPPLPKKIPAPAPAPALAPVSCLLVLAPAAQQPTIMVQLARTAAGAAQQQASLGLASTALLLEPSTLHLLRDDCLHNEAPTTAVEEGEEEKEEEVMLPVAAAALSNAGRRPTFARLESCDVNAVLEELVRHPSAMGRVPSPA